ncbi:MAG: helix-turn-helix transcriptional regulator [Gammaproteobacteria bacterium]|nr:helix-turn-helix transcriptional regulator [Gammaproteobacteria bacterium]
MKLTPELTDAAVLREIGERLERRRIDAGMTQARLAEEAGISKRTLERIEAGDSTDFVMLVRTLRVLDLLGALDQSLPDAPQSPLVLLKSRGRARKRVRRSRQSEEATPPGSGSSWKWRE